MADQRLLSIVERIVRLEEEKSLLSADISDIYKEAKSAGYAVPALREVVRRQRETADEHAKREAFDRDVELLIAVLGQYGGTPLGSAAIRAAVAAPEGGR